MGECWLEHAKSKLLNMLSELLGELVRHAILGCNLATLQCPFAGSLGTAL